MGAWSSDLLLTQAKVDPLQHLAWKVVSLCFEQCLQNQATHQEKGANSVYGALSCSWGGRSQEKAIREESGGWKLLCNVIWRIQYQSFSVTLDCSFPDSLEKKWAHLEMLSLLRAKYDQTAWGWYQHSVPLPGRREAFGWRVSVEQWGLGWFGTGSQQTAWRPSGTGEWVSPRGEHRSY